MPQVAAPDTDWSDTMNRINRLQTLLLGAALTASAGAFAEGAGMGPGGHGGPGGPHGGRHFEERISDALRLEDGQTDAVMAIMKEQHGKVRAVMQALHQQAKPELDTIHAETRSRLAGVLTPEQLGRFDEMHARRMERMQQRRERKGGADAE